MYRVGLTGGIASGKSTVLNWFKERGVPYIDADVVAREVVAPGQPGLEAIRDHFGSSILLPDGSLNRRALGDIVFADSSQRQVLNGLLHQPIRNQMFAKEQDFRQQGYSAVIFDIPLLIETNWQKDMSEVWLVYTNLAERMARLRDRDQFTEAQCRDRIASQMDLDAKCAFAQHIIDNSGSLDHLYQQLHTLWQEKGALFRKDL